MSSLTRFVLLWLGLSVCASSGMAQVLFEDGFEKPVDKGPRPVWSWKEPSGPKDPYGMMVGKGDIYDRSLGGAVAGKHFLRLKFDGRNGWCNTCGADDVQIESVSAQGEVVPSSVALFRPRGSGPRLVFSNEDLWSKWIVSSIDGGVVSFDGSKPVQNDMGGSGRLLPGQNLKVARTCGIDGNVGGNVNRRSDCNLAINYLDGIRPEHFPYGGTIARRFYLRIPKATILPDVSIKLGYVVFQRGGASYNVFPILSKQRGETLEVKTQAIADTFTITNFSFERDTWYYIEEVFTRESKAKASNGVYEIYAAPLGGEVSEPLARYESVEFGELKRMSIIGNWQHTNDAIGDLHIDEVVVATKRIGPVDQELSSPPMAPELHVQ